MSLNLHQVRHEVKQISATLIPNPANLLGLNECYRQLKALGWQSTNEVHPVARVSTFTLGSATIHYDRTAKAWQIEVCGGTLTRTGDLAAITAEAANLDAEAEGHRVWGLGSTPNPKPQTPASSLAAQHAAILTTEYPALATRIAAGLALAEAGVVEFPQYETAYDPATINGNRSCGCPDSVNRNPRARWGAACKHAIAQEIAHRVENERRATAYRKLTDRIEGDRARRLATQAGYDAALKPDRINRKAAHYSQHNGIGHR